MSKLQVRSRKKKQPRSLPPGQKLLLLLGLATLCAAVAAWTFQPRLSMQAADSQIHAPACPAPAAAPAQNVSALPFPLTQPMIELSQQIWQCSSNQPKLHAGVFIVEPDSGRYVDLDSHRAYSAASMIKLPVLVHLLEAVDAGQAKFDQPMVIRQDLKGGGSGYLQYRPTDSKISLNDCATLMMTISDNTATNMIIDLLGGKEKCNAEFSKWGLTSTHINDWLPDLPGTNTTSPYDLALLLAKVDSGQLLKPASRAWLFQTLEKNKIRTLLPMGIPPGTKIADKTGDIGTLVGDAGVITTKEGKRYIAVVSVERPWNDRRANALIRQISRIAYGGITGDTDGVKLVEQQQAVAAAPRAVRRASRRHRRRH